MEKRSSSFMASNARIAQSRTVSAPARHEGIGNALRAAFDPGSYGLTDEFTKLLRKLDR
ncbi:hypothetical protein [Sphingomonas sp. Root710]|uniref:hypothetical protein n=1 Tax=Sphingomonas sp. Root710 TaxID=1736594 RepID=UPI0012E39E81|nr:hypothetical protein [Sphingomonas sp. Root710]